MYKDQFGEFLCRYWGLKGLGGQLKRFQDRWRLQKPNRDRIFSLSN